MFPNKMSIDSPQHQMPIQSSLISTNSIEIIKQVFILLYSISNIATQFYIIPILPFLFPALSHPNELSWYKIGLVFAIYELGRFCGNILWIRLTKTYNASFLVLISLISLCILNLSFGFIKGFIWLILLRFIIGFCHNLPMLSKNIYIELSIRYNFQLKLFISTMIGTVIGIIIPLFKLSVAYVETKPFNQYIIMSLLVSVFHLATVLMLIVCIKQNILKFKTGSKFIEEVEPQENMKSKRTISLELPKIKLSNDDITSAERDDNTQNEEKNSNNLNTNPTKDEDDNNNNSNNQDLNMNNNSNNHEIDQSLNKKESNELFKKRKTTKQFKSPRNQTTTQNVSTNHFANTGLEINNSNNLELNGNVYITNKKMIYSLIYSLLEVNDIMLMILIICGLYLKYNTHISCLSFSFLSIQLILSIVNYPTNNMIIKIYSTKDKHELKSFILKLLYISLIISFLIGLLIPLYFKLQLTITLHKEVNIILLIVLYIIVLSRSLLNSNLIQTYHLYINKDCHSDKEVMISLNAFQNTAKPLIKSITYFIGSISYMLLTCSVGLKGVVDQVVTALYFMVLPEVILVSMLLLIRLYM